MTSFFGGVFGGGDKKDKSKLCSPNDYIADKLQKQDAENFAAAGILVTNSNGPASLELLLGRSSTKNEIEFLGGKRDAGEDVYTTASREFDEETSGVLSDIKKDLTHRQILMKACKDSMVMWFSKGRYALFLVPAPRLLNLVVFESASDTLPKRHKAFVQSGKARMKSSSFQEMQEIMWMPFANPQLPPHQKARDFMRSVFECVVFKVWLHANIYGQKPYVLHISGLDWNTKKDDIKAILEQIGPCKVSLEPHDDSSSSFKTNGKGTVTFDDRHHATTAVYLLNKSSYCGRALSLTWAHDQVPPSSASSIAHVGGGASAFIAPLHGGAASTSAPSAAADPRLSDFQPDYQHTHSLRGNPLAVPVTSVSHVVPAPPHAPTNSNALPVGWIEQKIADGTPFYVYTPTGHRTWDRPPAAPSQPHAPAPPPIPPPQTHIAAPPPPAASLSAPPPPPHASSFMDRGTPIAPPPTGSYGQYPGPPPPPSPHAAPPPGYAHIPPAY